jgi:hypothetical protein
MILVSWDETESRYFTGSENARSDPKKGCVLTDEPVRRGSGIRLCYYTEAPQSYPQMSSCDTFCKSLFLAEMPMLRLFPNESLRRGHLGLLLRSIPCEAFNLDDFDGDFAVSIYRYFDAPASKK